jgi:SAM-dependent methyltransferase
MPISQKDMKMNAPVALAERTMGGLHEFLVGVIESLRISRTARILDVGCGTGALVSRLSRHGFENAIGVDLDPPQNMGNLVFHRLDLNHHEDLKLGQFDLVTCVEVIEHIENIGNLLDYIKSTLAPDGIAIITTPNIESTRARIRALISTKVPHFDEKSDPTHLMPILRDSLEKMLVRRDMSIERSMNYPADQSKTVAYGKAVRFARNLTKLVVKDELYGDNLVHIIRHKG